MTKRVLRPALPQFPCAGRDGACASARRPPTRAPSGSKKRQHARALARCGEPCFVRRPPTRAPSSDGEAPARPRVHTPARFFNDHESAGFGVLRVFKGRLLAHGSTTSWSYVLRCQLVYQRRISPRSLTPCWLITSVKEEPSSPIHVVKMTPSWLSASPLIRCLLIIL